MVSKVSKIADRIFKTLEKMANAQSGDETDLRRSSNLNRFSQKFIHRVN